MRIAYENYIDARPATSLTALTVVTAYPVTNVQDQRLSTVYRSTAVTSQTITIDLGAATSITAAAIVAHNISTSATIIVAQSATDSWAGATSQTITHNTGVMVNYFTAKSFRWWQFQISDPTNTTGYLQIGRLWLGNYITIDPSSMLGFSVTDKRNDRVVYGRGRQKFASVGVGWRSFDLTFPPSNEAMITSLRTMYAYSGNHSSMIFCNFDTIRGYQLVEPCYCSLQGDMQYQHDERMKWTYRMTLEEDR